MYQQFWGYNVEEKLNLGVREQKRLNTTGLVDSRFAGSKPVEGEVRSTPSFGGDVHLSDPVVIFYGFVREPFRV
jgi:hypothetical protein